jgi:hypothetical protein
MTSQGMVGRGALCVGAVADVAVSVAVRGTAVLSAEARRRRALAAIAPARTTGTEVRDRHSLSPAVTWAVEPATPRQSHVIVSPCAKLAPPSMTDAARLSPSNMI